MVHFTQRAAAPEVQASSLPFEPLDLGLQQALHAALEAALKSRGVTTHLTQLRPRELRILLHMSGDPPWPLALRVGLRGEGTALAQSRHYAFSYESGDAGQQHDGDRDRQAQALVRQLAEVADQEPLVGLLRKALGGHDAAALGGLGMVAFARGEAGDFAVESCDASPGQWPRQLGPESLLLEINHAVQRFMPGSPLQRPATLAMALRGRGAAWRQVAGGLQRLRPVARCRSCAMRHACAGVWAADLEQPLLTQGNLPTFAAGPKRLVVSAARLFEREGRLQLAKDLKQALKTPGELRVMVVGLAPTALLDATAGDLAFLGPWQPCEPAAAAASLRDTALKLQDYRLPGRHGQELWWLEYSADPRATPLPRPTHLTLLANRRCVTVCQYCNLPLRLGSNMDLGEVMAALEEAAVLGTQHVELFGGEITLRKDLLLLLGLVRELHLQSDLTTTGVGPDRELLQALAQAGVGDLSISLDSAEAAVHDFLKNRQGMHAAATQAARTLVQAGARWVGVDTVVTRANFRGLPQLLEQVADLRLNGATFFLCQPIADIGNSDELLNDAEALELLTEVLPRCRQIAQDRGLKLAMRPPIDSEPGEKPDIARRIAAGTYNLLAAEGRRCQVTEQLVSVQPSGEVRLCNQPIWQFEPSGAVGNLREHSLAEVLRSEKARQFRDQAGQLPQCRYCSFDHGGCQP